MPIAGRGTEALLPLLLLLAVSAAVAPAASARSVGSGAAALLQAQDAAAPWFCHNLDCPSYTVIDTADDFETRSYPAGVWASTDVEAYAYALAARTGFQVRVAPALAPALALRLAGIVARC